MTMTMKLFLLIFVFFLASIWSICPVNGKSQLNYAICKPKEMFSLDLNLDKTELILDKRLLNTPGSPSNSP